MDGLMTSLTVVSWSLPAVFLTLSYFVEAVRPTMLVAAPVMVLIYLYVWLWWRPGTFSLGEGDLRLRFPLRTLVVPLSEVEGCDLWQQADLKSRYGKTTRVGAGGLWGGFGRLRSSSKEWIEFYISRQSDYVHIRRKGTIALLITPERASEFVAELETSLNAG